MPLQCALVHGPGASAATGGGLHSFPTTWWNEDIEALMSACCSGGHAANGAKATHAWVQHHQAARQRYWASLPDSIDFKVVSAAIVDGLRQQLKDKQGAGLAKQLQQA